jgi:FHA domain-containing protein
MMSIRVVSRGGEPLGTPLSATFDEAGGDIGRGADCTLVLPDPERRLSRKHVLVTCRDAQHFVRQIGANLDVELDGVPLAPGSEHALKPGARLRIGPYILQAHATDATARFAALFSAPPQPAPPPAAAPSAARPSVFGDLLRAGAPAPAEVAPLRTPIDLDVGEPAAPQEDALHALYDGLGLALPRDPGSAQPRLIGALLRLAIDGTLHLLAARSIAKRELGASPTLLQTRENNPLKFSPDVDAALGHLLGHTHSGFMAPQAAVRAAFEDLQAHEVAVLAGMRAALSAVLARFDPAALEQRLAPAAMWDNLMPAARKARLWEGYGAEYARLMREIDDDFDAVFGRAFLKAYQAQLAELSRGDDGRGAAR